MATRPRSNSPMLGWANDECFEACSDAWGGYIKGSLRSLIATGKGQPNVKES